MFEEKMGQLELFERDTMSEREIERALDQIRNHYWEIRNTRIVTKYGRAKKRRVYRKVAAIKKRLLLAGADERGLLDYLKHCRLQCAGDQRCKYCAKYFK